MSALGSLVVKLALEYAEYTQGLEQSDQASLRFAQNAQRHFDRASNAGKEFFADMAKTAVTAVVAYASVGTVIEQLNRSIDSLASLDDLTQKTGATVENLSRLQQVAGAFGTDFGKVDGALTKLAKGMAGIDDESSKTTKGLAALGVSAKDVEGKLRDPAEVLVDVAKGLQDYEDGAAKAALINDVFGKSGADLLPYLNDVAESVDKFTGVSADAAAAAARYQDQLGLLQVNYRNMATAVTAAALPALNDLLGAFSDTATMEGKLADGPAGEWADDLAVGVARVVDVAKLLPAIFSAVAGSFKAVYADLELVASASHNLSPAVVAVKLAQGRNPLDDMRKALADRNKVVDEANKRYEELWNKPADMMEQAMLARIAARTTGGAAPAAAAGAKKSLDYSTASDRKGAEKSDYEALNKALQEKIALSGRELELARPLTEAERQIATMVRGRAEGTLKLSDVEQTRLESGLLQLSLNQQLLVSRGEAERLETEARTTRQKQIATAFESVDALQAEIDNYGKLPEQITRATIAKLEQRKASLEANEGSQAEIDTVEALIVANTRLAELQGKKTTLEKGAGVTEAKELLDVMSSLDEVAKSAAAGMANSFGKVGSAIGGVTTVMTGYGRAQAAVAAQLATSLKAAGGDQAKIFQAHQTAASQAAQAQIRSYGDMASAGKAFFSEHSAGYRALETAEKAFRAVEMAMAIENALEKSGLVTAFTSLFVASKATEETVDAAATGKSVVNSGVRAAADGVAAFAKTMASLPFPANVAAGAGVLALLAGVGVAIGGGGGGGANVAKDRQEQQGTGTVLGDAGAKSDSIARSLDQMEKNSDIELSHTAGMLQSLRSIDSSLSGLGNLLVRSSGLTGEMAQGEIGAAEKFVKSTVGTLILGGPIGLVIDKLTGGLASGILGKVAGAIFGGKVTTLDTGVTVGKTSLGGALAGGVTASQYTDIKKSGGLFRKDKESTKSLDLGAEANDQFTKVIRGLAGSVTEAGKLLGLGGDEFTARLNAFVIDIGKISLKDLSGEEIQKQLEAVFSKLGDDLAKYSVGGLEQFQQVGEGYFATLTRIASNYANLDSILASTGSTFGATGLASIAMRERFIELNGGIDDLASKTGSFAEQFLSEAERLAPVQKYVTEQLAGMGLAGITTRDQFRDTVLGLAASGALATEAGAKQYAALLDLADAFAKTHAATEDLTRSQEAVADERKALQERYDQATMTSAELLERERAAKDRSNLALYDQTIAAEKARAATQALADANTSIQEDINALKKALLPLSEQRKLEVAGMHASTLALYEQREALQMQTRALEVAKANREIEIQIMRLTGNAAGALAAARADELAGLDASTAALIKQRHAAEDQAKALEIAKSNRQIEIQIMKLSGNAAGALAASRADELVGLDASTVALIKQKNALEDQAAVAERLTKAVDAAFSALTKAVDAEKKALQIKHQTAMDLLEKQADAGREKVDKLTSLSSALHSVIDAIDLPEQAKSSRMAAQAQLAAALAIAKAGGPLPGADALKGALSTLSKDSSAQFGSYLDYQRDAYRTANDLADLTELTDSQLSIEQKTLNALLDQKGIAQRAYETEVARLDKIVDTAREQINALNGISAGIGGVSAALVALGTAIKAAISNPAPSNPAPSIPTPGAPAADAAAIKGAYQQYLGRDADASEIDYWKAQAASGRDAVAAIKGSQEAQVQNLYRTLLGRMADRAHADFWTRQLQAGKTFDQVKASFMDSDEYKSQHIPAFAKGGFHTGGLRLVGENGPELEVTGPARIFNAQQTAAMFGGSGNAELIAEVRELRRELVLLKGYAERTAVSSEGTARTLSRATQGQDYIMTKGVSA